MTLVTMVKHLAERRSSTPNDPHSTQQLISPHANHLDRHVMPIRIACRAHRVTCPIPAVRCRIRLQRRFASNASNTPEVYDVVCVGGGPAGLSLLAALKASPVTNRLKVALIEGQDLQKNRLPKDASLDSFSNRCSSLTPASMRNLQGRHPVRNDHCNG